MSLEEQLRNDAESLKQVGWFNRAQMFNAAADEIQRLKDHIKQLEEDSERLNWLLNRGVAWRDCYDGYWKEGEWLYASKSALELIDKAKESKP